MVVTSLAARASERATSPRTVVIWVAGDAAALEQVRTSAEELLGRLDVSCRVTAARWPEQRPLHADSMLHAYVDVRSGTDPTLVVVDPRRGGELTRRTLARKADLAVSVEALMHVLYVVSESIVGRERNRGGPVPVAQPAASVPERTGGVAPTRAFRALFAPGVVGRVVSFGGERLLAGAGVSVALRTPAQPLGGSIVLWSAVHSSSELAYDDYSARLRPVTVQLSPRVESRFSRGLSGFVGASAGVDCLLIDAKRAPAGTETADAALKIDALLGAVLGLRVHLDPIVTLETAVGVDLDLTPRQFAADVAGERYTLLELPRVRPWLMLGSSFTLSRAPQRDPTR